jgi:Glycosyl hydrolase catalytic core
MILTKPFSHKTSVSVLLVGIALTSCSDAPGGNSGGLENAGSQSGTGSGGALPNPGSGTGAGNGTGGAPGSGVGSSAGAGSTSSGSSPAHGSGGTTSEYTGKCKRGIPFDRWVEPQPTLADLDAISPAAFWFYTWNASPNTGLDYGSRNFEFVPMIRSGEFNPQEVLNDIPSSATHLLGFNEPMISGQGGVDMTLDEVLARWPEVEKIADARGLKLLSPAMTFSNIPGREDGPEFMEAFFNACPDCRIDAIAVHTYTCEVEWVRDHIEPYRKFGLPIWVTEFACIDGDKERVKRFMRETVDFFEKDPLIERYAWFMSRAGDVSLLNGSGQLTELGQIYVDQPYNEACVR